MQQAAVLPDGLPERIDARWFRSRYGDKFSTLLSSAYDTFLSNTISDVYADFAGVQDLWSLMRDKSVWVEKSQLCYGLLTAWYITDLYPEYADGVVSSGGIPIKMKSIGGVKIQFNTDTARLPRGAFDALEGLKSNPFGYKAYMMIKSAAANYRLFVRSAGSCSILT